MASPSQNTNTKLLVPFQGSPLIPTITPLPTLTSPSELRIRLKAIAINPADIKTIDHGHRVTSWPLVPGLDGAGFVEAVGEGVKRFKVGDEALAIFTPGDRGASYQNFAVVQEGMVARKPATWPFEDAASLGVCYMTALVGLGISLKISLPFLPDGPITSFAPSSVLILGGSSAVGAATIQLLRLALPDCRILVTSSPKHFPHLKDTLGANGAFDRNSSSMISDIKSSTPGKRGVDAIIDAVGAGATQRDIFDAFSEEGAKRYAQVWTGDEEIHVPEGVNSVLFRGRDLPQLKGGENIMVALERLLEEGRYKVPLPVKKVGEGWEALERGLELMRRGVSGEKLVVIV